MKKSFNKKKLGLMVAALTLTAGVSVGSAMAYFTTYTTASGGVTLSIKGTPEIVPQETVENMTKKISVKNTGGVPCFARVKVFAGSTCNLTFTPDAEGTWSLGEDGYYVCNKVIEPKETSGTFEIKIEAPEGEHVNEFNVIVVQECTAVQYKEDGTPYADWNKILDTTEETYGKEEGAES